MNCRDKAESGTFQHKATLTTTINSYVALRYIAYIALRQIAVAQKHKHSCNTV